MSKDNYYNRHLKKATNPALKGFINEMAVNGYKPSTLIKYVYMVNGLIKSSKKTNLKKITKDDITKYLEELSNGSKLHAKKKQARSQRTVNGTKECLKRFFKWLLGKDEDYPSNVKWLKIKSVKNNILPEQLFTPDDVEKMIKACNNPRDKAIVSLLWESGARIGEIMALKVKNFEDKEEVAHLVINISKTESRKIPIIESLAYLKAWLQIHPLRNSKDFMNKPLFVSIRRFFDRPLGYFAYSEIIKSVVKEAKLKKSKINPHQFRHSRATFLAKRLTEPVLKNFMGWIKDSRMVGRYVHLSGRDLDNNVLKMYGVETTKEGKLDFKKPLTCKRCDFVNEPESKLCAKCNYPLTIEEALKGKVKVGKDFLSPEMIDRLTDLIKAKLKK